MHVGPIPPVTPVSPVALTPAVRAVSPACQLVQPPFDHASLFRCVLACQSFYRVYYFRLMPGRQPMLSVDSG